MAKKNKRKNNQTAEQLKSQLNDPIVQPEEPRREPKPLDKTKADPKPSKEPKEPTVLASIAGALDEDYSEIDEVMSPQPVTNSSKKKYPTSQKVFFGVGVFILIMAIVGIISTFNFCKNAIGEIVDQTALKNELAVYIYPVVASDPPAFENVEDLPSSTMITCSIWQIILNGNTSNYTTTDDFYMSIPEIDVESAAGTLFGYGFVIEHQTVGYIDSVFEYNADTKCYIVPIDPPLNSYAPKITALSNVGELYTVTVDYMPPSALAIAGIDTANEPDKTMIYTISKSKGKMTINSIAHADSENTPHEY